MKFSCNFCKMMIYRMSDWEFLEIFSVSFKEIANSVDQFCLSFVSEITISWYFFDYMDRLFCLRFFTSTPVQSKADTCKIVRTREAPSATTFFCSVRLNIFDKKGESFLRVNFSNTKKFQRPQIPLRNLFVCSYLWIFIPTDIFYHFVQLK